MKLSLLLFAGVCGALSLWPKSVNAAIPRDAASRASSTYEALRLPLGERMSALQLQGPQGYRNLRELMFDGKQSMETRWRAVTAAGLLGGKESRPELERALRAPEWFMRNAGLIAITNVDRGWALNWSRKLLSDKALVVRAAAVDALAELQDRASIALLWKKLDAKENFKGKQSLFIRRRIVETLAQLEGAGHEAKFIAVLSDRDESLHGPAIRALERITQKTMGEPQEPVAFKKAHWQRWWKEKGTATM
jgi:hypothetical protein